MGRGKKCVLPFHAVSLQKWSGLDRRLLEDDARRGDVSGLRDAISTTRRRAFLGTLILFNWSTPSKLKPLVNSGRTWASHTLTHNVQFLNIAWREDRKKLEHRLPSLHSTELFVSNLTVFSRSRNFTVSWKPKMNRVHKILSFDSFPS
jgi:hypothetical protein